MQTAFKDRIIAESLERDLMSPGTPMTTLAALRVCVLVYVWCSDTEPVQAHINTICSIQWLQKYFRPIYFLHTVVD